MPSTSTYVGFCNGGSSALYDHGVTVSTDPLNFPPATLVNPRNANGWRSQIKAAPTPIIVGTEIWVYSDGYGTEGVGNVFLDKFDFARNPIDYDPLSAPVFAAPEVPGAASIARPSVIYEPWDTAAPFKMVFAIATVAGQLNKFVWLATSLDGVNWTPLGQAFGRTAAWESGALMTTGRLVNKDGVYHIFYGGYNGSYWQGGVATKSEFSAGGWVKNANNPILKPKGAFNVSPTLDLTMGQSWFRVPDSSLFDQYARVMAWLPSDPAKTQINRIANIASSTDIGVCDPWAETFSVAAGAKVSLIYSRSVDPCEVWFDPLDSKWKTVFTAFSFNPNANRETTAHAETSDLDAGFSIVPDKWPLELFPRSSDWNKYQAENLKFVRID